MDFMENALPVKNRFLWIDIMRGIGILALVWIHLTSDRFFSVFRMPLFFMISGFLQKPREARECLRRSFLRLMVPYFAFLLVLSIPEALRCIRYGHLSALYPVVLGGKSLTGIFGVFWFFTVLFLSKNLFNIFLRRNWLSPWIFLSFLGLAYVVEYTGIQLVWGAEIVPAALFFLWVGNRSAYLFPGFLKWIGNSLWARLFFGITIVCLLFIAWIWKDSLYIDMKYSRLGVPVVSICMSICLTWGLAALSIVIERWKHLAAVFAFIGKAAMSIIFLHLPVFFYLKMENLPVCISFILTIALCLLADRLLRESRFTRTVFLGID